MRRGRGVALGGAVAALLALPACATSAKTVPEPSAGPWRAPQGTMARAHAGQHLVVTAVVAGVLSDRALVLRDADLPPRGLLVVSARPVRAQTGAVVRAEGTVAVLRPGAGDGDPVAGLAGALVFAGQKYLAAAAVTPG